MLPIGVVHAIQQGVGFCFEDLARHTASRGLASANTVVQLLFSVSLQGCRLASINESSPTLLMNLGSLLTACRLQLLQLGFSLSPALPLDNFVESLIQHDCQGSARNLARSYVLNSSAHAKATILLVTQRAEPPLKTTIASGHSGPI